MRIRQCVLSHWHYDHVGGIRDLRDLCREVEQGKDEKEEDDERKSEEELVDLKIYKYPFYDSSPNLPNAETRSRDREVELLTSANNDQDVGFLHDLHDGQILSIGSTEAPLELRVLHTPGHTTDHIALVITSSPSDPTEVGTIFTGDAVLGHGTAVFEDLGMYMLSLSKMRDTIQGYNTGQKEAVKAFPGHGAVIPDAAVKIEEYISHRAMRQRQVLDVLSLDFKQGEDKGDNLESQTMAGRTSMQIVKVVYKDVPESLHDAAEGGVMQILKKLEAEGKVERIQMRSEEDGEDHAERWRVLDNKNKSQDRDWSGEEQAISKEDAGEKAFEARRKSTL